MGVGDPAHALAERLLREGSAGGPLEGLSFCVKDVFDLAGRVTGAGTADWAATHQPARDDAHVVTSLLEAGADLIGVAKMTELSRGLSGHNLNYDRPPVNLAAPGRVTGGSSSGPAAAVRAGTADFAIGSDTNGSVRVPASFCGIYGMRPTRDRVSTTGLMPHCPSFDTVGWFSRSPATLRDVGSAMLRAPTVQPRPDGRPRVAVARDLFALVDPPLRERYRRAVSRLAVSGLVEEEVDVLAVEPAELLMAQLVVQGRENHALYNEWFDSADPRLSLGVARKVIRDAGLTAADERNARAVLRQAASSLHGHVADGRVVLMPTTSTFAWEVGLTEDVLPDSYQATGALISVATCAGLPEISMPLVTLDGLPMGLSVLGSAGADEVLLGLATRLDLWASR